MSTLYAGFLHPHPAASVMVFETGRAVISVGASGADGSLVAGGLSRRVTSPDELRDFGLKCMAAAEVMEKAGEE